MAKWRLAKWLKSPTTTDDKPSGSAPIETAPQVAPSMDAPPITSTFATAVTEAALSSTEPNPLPPTTVASDTGNAGSRSTESVMKLSSAIETPNEELESWATRVLPQNHLTKLLMLAHGSNEPLGEVIRSISAFYLEEESEFEEIGLDYALVHYVENQLL